MCFAPFFGEYTNYVHNYQAQLVVVPPNPPSFQPNLDMLQDRITERTIAIIINNPNNERIVIEIKRVLSIFFILSTLLDYMIMRMKKAHQMDVL